MTRGVRVIGRDADGSIVEIEYFYGIDVADLDHIPEFTKVPAFWPQYRNGTWVVYTVNACHKRARQNEVHLEVTYDKANQTSEFLEQYGELDINWVKNTIILQQGEQKGRCEWLCENWKEVTWEVFEVVFEPCARAGYLYRGSKREAQFRTTILDCDDRRCVLTGETTVNALDAAHLVPAAKRENDMPCNGITLRADLHRLFDADLFTFAKDGRVVDIAPGLSEDYRQLLEKCDRLPSSTLGRVRATLALRSSRTGPAARDAWSADILGPPRE